MSAEMARKVRVVSEDGELYANLHDLTLVVEELADEMLRPDRRARVEQLATLTTADGATEAMRAVAQMLRALREA